MIEVTEEMSGGLRHHNDEEHGPSHAVGHQSSKQDRYSVERNQCLCADAKGVFVPTQKRSPSLLTRPTSLEMLKNSFTPKSQK
jgi:hypothetical protein